MFGASLVETHAFEWFISNTKYNGKTDYAFNEIGFIKEVGVQIKTVVEVMADSIRHLSDMTQLRFT